MMLSHKTNFTLRGTMALAALATLAACGDSSIAPKGQRALVVDRPVLDRLLGTSTITYNPTEGMYAAIGSGNAIYIPAGGVCDPATSSYGPGTWDNACSTSTKSIAITASSYLDMKGHPYIQFSPALRFVPGKTVILYIADNKAVLDGTARITYCPDAGSCIDEGKTDASLWTFHWGNGVYRRIKHFSGYNVAAGLDDLLEGLFSRSASTTHSAASSNRSGYMVVSGLELPRDPSNSTNFGSGGPVDPEK